MIVTLDKSNWRKCGTCGYVTNDFAKFTYCPIKYDAQSCPMLAQKVEMKNTGRPNYPYDILPNQPTDLSNDPVNYPSHYTFSKYQIRDVLDEWQLGEYPNLIIAYLARAPHKGNELQDLKKAKWYLDRYISLKESKK